MGHVRVPMRPAAVTAYEVLARQAELPAPKAEALAPYTGGFEHYQTRRWEEALPAFEGALRLDPGDGPSRFYRDRCQALLVAPPKMIVL